MATKKKASTRSSQTKKRLKENANEGTCFKIEQRFMIGWTNALRICRSNSETTSLETGRVQRYFGFSVQWADTSLSKTCKVS